MIDLYEAFKLTKIQMEDVVFLKTCDAVKGQHQILTKKEIVQKLDAAIDSMTNEKEARIVESRHRMTSV